MMIIWLLMVVFIILLILPIFVAIQYYKLREGEILFINQDKIRDPRYFGKSFSELIKKNMPKDGETEIKLSKKESFIDGDRQKSYQDVISSIVICRKKEFKATKGTIFEKEVYAGKDVHIEEEVKLRAAYSERNMVLESGVEITRWVDAKGTVAIYDNCILGVSASSESRMSIGENCVFKRLYAPEICFGQYPGQILDSTEGKDPRIYRLPVQTAKEKNVRYLSDEDVNEEGIVDYSVISWKNVSVTENIIVTGDIRSHRGVRLFDGAIVVGNIFAEKEIILGKNSCVIGNVFSQESVYLEKGSVIGKPGAISSLVARETVEIEVGCFIYGYINCEKGGRTSSSIEHKVPDTYMTLERMKMEKILTFKDLRDYESIDQQRYRFYTELEEAIIPEGAKKIPRSMFFKCSALKKVQIPDSIEEIEDYAFADCVSLSEVSLLGKNNLKKIGDSAFSNCAALKKVDIPSTVEVLEAAAFADCTELKEVSIAENSNLRFVGDHCFLRCNKLNEVVFTNYIEKVSANAFKDCESLKQIKMPEKIVEQDGE